MFRWRLVPAVAAVIFVSGFGPAASAAETERVAVIWDAPAGCPTSAAVNDEVEKTLAGSLKEVAPVAAAVSVPAPADGRWRATLVVHSHGKRAERQFEAESCGALASAAAVIIALAAEGEDDGPSTQPAPRRPAENTIQATPAPAAPATPESGWNDSGPALLVGGVFDTGTMPGNWAAGIEASAEQGWSTALWRLRLIAGASFFLPQDMGNPMIANYPAGKYWMVSFSGRACLTAALSVFEIGPCFGGELAVMHATDIGGGPEQDTQYWAAPLGSGVAAVTVAPKVVLFARADAVFPTTRRSFTMSNTVGGVSDVYKIPSFATRFAAGLELRFF
jgi:hypothetical protein